MTFRSSITRLMAKPSTISKTTATSTNCHQQQQKKALFQTEIFMLKKSKFLASAQTVHSEREALQFLDELKLNNKKISEATHNIVAYRLKANTAKSPLTPSQATSSQVKTTVVQTRSSVKQQEKVEVSSLTSVEVIERRDDDGESGAGDQVLSLLKRYDVVGVVVVVTRWYGGVNLGADRFKMINQSAKQVLQDMGLIPK